MTPTELAQRADISVAYASQLLNGKRQCSSLSMALKIYDATNLQFGPLRGLSEQEIEPLRVAA